MAMSEDQHESELAKRIEIVSAALRDLSRDDQQYVIATALHKIGSNLVVHLLGGECPAEIPLM
jgi:hypothetical protein